MIIPVGKVIQKMTYIVRKSKNKFEKKTFGNFNFVPMLKDKNYLYFF
jgi:protein-L-isoaspartate O-methyltransferase